MLLFWREGFCHSNDLVKVLARQNSSSGEEVSKLIKIWQHYFLVVWLLQRNLEEAIL